MSVETDLLRNSWVFCTVEPPEVGFPGIIGWIRHTTLGKYPTYNIVNFTGFLFILISVDLASPVWYSKKYNPHTLGSTPQWIPQGNFYLKIFIQL